MRYLYILTLFTALLFSFDANSQCTHTIQLTDTWGDGWNGGRVAVSVNGVDVLTNLGSTFTTGLGPISFNFTASAGQTIRVRQTTAGTYPAEMRIRVINSAGTQIIGTVQPVTGTATTGGSIGTAACPAGGAGVNVPLTGSNSVACGTNTTLYDHAGSAGVYSNNANGFTVLNNAGSAIITISGTSSGESCCDYVRVYRGTNTAGVLVGTYYMNSAIPTITSTAGQPLTVQFVSDGSVTGNGFSINVTYSGSCSVTTCSGTPLAGTSTISAASGCSGSAITLTASGLTSATGITYQWQSAPTAAGTWTDIAGQTSTTLSTTAPATTTFYRLRTTCSSGGAVNYTNTVSYTVTGTGCAGVCATNISSLPVSGQSVVCNGSNLLSSANVPACGLASTLYLGGNEALYSVVPTTTGTYTISYSGQSYSSIWVWSGACPNAGGTCVGSVSGAGTVQTLSVAMTAGVTYFILFDTWPSPASPCPGTFSISQPPSAPANDLVCNAIAISCGATVSGTTINATNSGTGENQICGTSQTMPGVWYVVPGNGQTMTASLCGTAWDSKMSVFSGTSCAALACIGGVDDAGPACATSSASYSWTSVVGQNYYILVHGYSTDAAFSLALTCSTPPPASPTSITASTSTICSAAGTNVTLTANGASGTVYWFTGTCATTGQIATGNTLTVSPTATTTYFARNYNGTTFSTTCASTTVNVTTSPTINAGTNTSLCSGSTVQLNATASGASSGSLTTTTAGGNGCGGGNMFDVVAGANPITINGFTITPYATAVQSVNVYYRSGSHVGNTTTIGSWTLLGTYSVNGVAATQIFMPTGNINIPAGATYGIYVQYNAQYTDGSGSFSNGIISINTGVGHCTAFDGCCSPRMFNGTVHYTVGTTATVSWNNAGSLNNASILNPVASPTATTTYTATATANGCSATSQVTVTVNTSPTASISGTNTICSGNSSTFTASGGGTYNWSTGASTSSISVSTGQSYTVTVTAANGCTATSNRALTVNTTPSAPTASATQTFCTGVSSTVADLTTTSGSGIQWYNVSSGGSALASGSALSNGTYYVSQSTGSCESSRLAVTVTANAQPTDPAGIATNDVLWKGGAANPNDWSTASNWYVKTAGGYTVAPVTPAATTNVFVGNTGSCINNSVVNLAGLTRCKNLYIESGATLNLGGSSDVLEVYGNWDNNGTLNANTSTVKFISPNNQSLNTAATTETFYNLYIDNNNSSNQNYLLTNKSVNVLNTFHMEGNVRMNTNTVLEIGSATNPGEVLWHDGVVIGPMKRWFLGNSSINVQSPSFHNVTTGSPHLNPAGIFPVGVLRTLPGGAVEHEHKNASVNFKTPVTTAGHLTVEFITSNANVLNANNSITTAGQTIGGLLVNTVTSTSGLNAIDFYGYWKIDADPVLMTVPYDASFRALNIDLGSNPADVRVLKTSSFNAWNDGIAANNGSNTTMHTLNGSNVHNDRVYSIENLLGFSGFTFGFNGATLPIQLSSFIGETDNAVNYLKWTTQSEQNSSHFEIERSVDAINFEKIGRVNAMGVSNQVKQYSFNDVNPIRGMNYYRLKMVDIDGTNANSNTIALEIKGKETTFVLFPNPTTDVVSYQYEAETNESLNMEVVNALGQVVISQTRAARVGTNSIPLNMSELAPGAYTVRVKHVGTGITHSEKIIKK